MFSELTKISLVNGDVITCKNLCNVNIEWKGRSIVLEVLVMDDLALTPAIMGMDFVEAIGGICVTKQGSIIEHKPSVNNQLCLNQENRNQFSSNSIQGKDSQSVGKSENIQIEDIDFSASFLDDRWVVKWNWDSVDEPILSRSISQYKTAPEIKERFVSEVRKWISNKWLIEYEGEIKGSLPLMAVFQEHKDKVRPVMDFRKLNAFVSSHTGDSVVCNESLRKWRQMGSNLSLLDLSNAYLQIHVDKSMWPYQIVNFEGKTYCLTRLGFGLNVAPKIMTKIVNAVLSSDPIVRSGTDSYIDDIVINEDIVCLDKVKKLLDKFNLVYKDPLKLNSARVLGLKTFEQDKEILWKRDDNNILEEIKNKSSLSKREIFSVCGKLVGHFPVCGWLRPYCSFVKRGLNSIGWDEEGDLNSIRRLKEIVTWLESADPVQGKWAVKSRDECTVWCDASSIAMGVCIEVEGNIIEDASWLRPENDAAHINVAELEAVVKGLNLAIKWGFKHIKIMTDSATVYSWINSTTEKDKRVKVSGLSEVLVKRRLGLLLDLINVCDLTIELFQVSSSDNKADVLTRVPKKWLQPTCMVAMVCDTEEKKDSILKAHKLFHGGSKKTFYAVGKMFPDLHITEDEVEEVIGNCSQCLSIDPNPIRYEKGHLDSKQIWHRVAIDVTHYKNKRFLSIIDCGPSRYAIWRFIRDEEASTILNCLETIFRMFGFPVELLLDNSRSFKSDIFQTKMKWLNIHIHFRCANKPSGNGIVERNHRTVKRTAARSNCTIEDAVFWYNALPRKDGKIPCQLFLNRRFRLPYEKPKNPVSTDSYVQSDFNVGDRVFVRPQAARCVDTWKEGAISKIQNNRQSLEVDGTPFHVSHVRKIPNTDNVANKIACDPENEWVIVGPKRRPRRNKGLPERFGVIPY